MNERDFVIIGEALQSGSFTVMRCCHAGQEMLNQVIILNKQRLLGLREIYFRPVEPESEVRNVPHVS